MRKFSGYMTVEASFVVPVVICTFALIIHFSNYLYTRCVLSQDCYVLAFRAANSRDFEGDMGAYVMNNTSKVIGEKYFGSKRPLFSTSVSGDRIEVSGRTEVNHSGIGIFQSISGFGWDICVTVQAKRRDPAAHLRSVKRIRDIGEDVLNKLENKE